MASWMKYSIIIAFILGVLVFTVFAGLNHQANVTSTQEVDIGLSTSNVGLVREDLTSFLSRDEAIAEVLSEIAMTQKEHDGETLVEYVFLDEAGNPTDDEEKMMSIQFVVKLLNDKNDVISISTERIELDTREVF